MQVDIFIPFNGNNLDESIIVILFESTMRIMLGSFTDPQACTCAFTSLIDAKSAWRITATEFVTKTSFCSLLCNKNGLTWQEFQFYKFNILFIIKETEFINIRRSLKTSQGQKNMLKGYNYFYYSMSSGRCPSLQNSLTKIQYISLSSHNFYVLFLHLLSVPMFELSPHFLISSTVPEGLKCPEAQKLGLSQSGISSGN